MTEPSNVPAAPPEPRVRLPVVPETHRASIHEFLEHFWNAVDRELNDHRALAFQYRTSAYDGRMAYLRHKKATIEHLIAMNDQRRKRVKVSRTR